jgi:hypothetical protein
MFLKYGAMKSRQLWLNRKDRIIKTFLQTIQPFLLIAAVLVVAFGCIPDLRSYCENRNDCIDGNDNDLKACKDDMRRLRDVADIYGCKDQFKNLLSCTADNGECLDTMTIGFDPNEPPQIKHIYMSTDACSSEFDSYRNCMPEETSAFPYWSPRP